MKSQTSVISGIEHRPVEYQPCILPLSYGRFETQRLLFAFNLIAYFQQQGSHSVSFFVSFFILLVFPVNQKLLFFCTRARERLRELVSGRAMSINKSNSALMRKDKIANEIRQQIENSKAISNKLQNPSNTIQNNEVLPENVANYFLL